MNKNDHPCAECGCLCDCGAVKEIECEQCLPCWDKCEDDDYEDDDDEAPL